jgi:hypothetical protein
MRLPATLLALSLSAPLYATAPAMHDREPMAASGRQIQRAPLAAPEFDIAAAPGAITLLAGSVAILLGRIPRRRK